MSMKKKKFQLFGMSVKQIGGVTLCVILSVLIFIFGEHDTDVDAGATFCVDASWESVDGDLDFGELGAMSGEAGRIEKDELVPTKEPEAPLMNAGTEEEPLILNDEYFRYLVIEGKATVSEVLVEGLEEAVIPAKIEGFPVESLGEYLFQDYSSLRRISLPEGLKEIRWNVFENCTSLEAVEFPATLTTIMECAFWNSGLKTVTLPATIRTIEDYAFVACEGLTELRISDTSRLDMIFDLPIVERIEVMEGVSAIDEEAFAGAESLVEVKLPSTLSMIKQYAFYDCGMLEYLELPDSVVSIGANAFENCYSLKEVKLPEGLLLLSEFAFYSCWELEELILPDGITTIQDYAFEDCEKLVLLVTSGSIGEEYAINNDYLYEIKE